VSFSLFIADSSVPEQLLDCYKTQIAWRNNRLLSLFALFLLVADESKQAARREMKEIKRNMMAYKLQLIPFDN